MTTSAAPAVSPVSTSTPAPLARTVSWNIQKDQNGVPVAVIFSYKTSNKPGDPIYDSPRYALSQFGMSSNLPETAINGRCGAICRQLQAAIDDPASGANVTATWTLRITMSDTEALNYAASALGL